MVLFCVSSAPDQCIYMSLKTFFPILELVNSYSKEDFKRDLYAGLIVGIILVPQGMAYSMLADKTDAADDIKLFILS